MEKLRYNRTFKQGMTGVLIFILISGLIFVLSVISKIQYDAIVSNMERIEATIIDIDWNRHRRGPNEQEIYISYEVDGTVYERQLGTDTSVSFAAGMGAHYSVGDKVEIFYDPQNPEVIASPRSVVVGYFYMGISALSLAGGGCLLFFLLKHKRKFLVTQAEYEKEGEEIKKSKAKAKKQKERIKAEKRKKYAKARKVFKVILIVLAVPLGAFILFLLFGALLMALGY